MFPELYTLLGYDFRIPGNGPKTVDASLWERAQDVYQCLADSACSENIAQLLGSVDVSHRQP